MEIPVNKSVKVIEHNGSLIMSIPNMVHTMTGIKEGDSILYNTINYKKNSKDLKLELKIIKEKKTWLKR